MGSVSIEEKIKGDFQNIKKENADLDIRYNSSKNVIHTPQLVSR